MQGSTDFNKIAPVYDLLSQLVFGHYLRNVQIESLQFIPANSTVLIVGGGTGWILDEISKIYPSGLKITYVEKSSKMIQLSKKRKSSNNDIEFMQGSIESFDLSGNHYDVILTPFILDCFSEDQLRFVFQKLDASLVTKGLWLYIDFFISSKSKFWQKMTMNLMYTFFQLTCKLDVKKLAPVSIYFAAYQKLKEKKYLKDFIIMQVFQKNSMCIS